MKVVVHTDGGSRGNPGPAASGFVLADDTGKRRLAKAFFLGEATNNVAEYTALIRALEAANDLGATEVTVYTDSELMVRHLQGAYKVKSDLIRPLFEQVSELRRGFGSCRVVHVTRDNNKEADRLVNQALDAGHDIEEGNRSAGLLPVSIKGASPLHCHGQDARATDGRHAHATETPHGIIVNAHDDANRKTLRLGVLISGGGRTLLNIHECIQRGELNARVAVVISSLSTVAGVERARNAGFPVKIARRKDFPDIDAFSARLEEELTAAGVDLVVQGGWLCLWKIPPRYENCVMNIHPALLPSFGGQGMWGHHVHEAVLAAGCKVSGCTVHFCTNEYDRGPIIVQRTCPVLDDDTADTLADRVFEQECLAFPEAIKLFIEGRLRVEGNRVYVK
ncbi:MAG TPA: phosphoribosylglycinamide formyltransferase [Sedimentisphaerales bacterium]|jgi:formyltetrahydrofolate-dependent phosphoribosylglycinamide formyltransferase|nr:phosphoribosylglycinamide formyltransferase [Sedimentisphaerales bacterium]HNU30429.1 phosphoribosylglycinamide formyltransferase [Sedimentisphaerales bacterium]